MNQPVKNVLAIILAGGKGSRLEPLTRDRAKPAVPFGGSYRIIDFALSNCLNSGLRKLLVLTQYKALSLDRHINNGWRNFFCNELGEFIDLVPPQQRIDEHWYQGTADAVYQNIYELEKQRPAEVLILAGDHIYKMNYRRMVEYHRANNADLTVAALETDVNAATQFGVMSVDAGNRIVGFDEKPNDPATIPGRENACLVSMGIYVFSARFLFEHRLRDANETSSSHDFGKDIIPSIIGSSRIFAFPFQDENRKQTAYWRDVGTIDAFYKANMDLVSVDPQLNMYGKDWPIRMTQEGLPPPKFVFGRQEDDQRVGTALDSIICPGSIVSGGKVEGCILGPQVRINSYASVIDSILFEGVQVGRHAKIRNAIIDKHVVIPPNVEIGYDVETDRARGFMVSPEGVVVLGKSAVVETAMPTPSWMKTRLPTPEKGPVNK